MKKVRSKKCIQIRVRAFAFMMALICMAFSLNLNVYAETSQEVTEARNGVLRVDLLYVDKDNNEYLLGSGSGFLINNDTIITCAHVVNLSADSVGAAEEAIGGDFKKNYKDRLKIRVVVMRDVYVYATVKNQSEQTDFAILSLNDAIYDREPLTLDTSGSIDSTAQVYALGFPAAPQYYQNVNSYTYDDVSVTDGKVTKLTTINNVEMIQHSAVLGGGNSGGPLVTDSGCVVGVNNATIDNSYYYAISIDQVVNALDALGVEYATNESGTTTDNSEADDMEPGNTDGEGGSDQEDINTDGNNGDVPEPEPTVDKTALSSAISEARNKEVETYTEESVADYNELISEAEEVNDNEEATQIEVDSMTQRLQAAATDVLKEKQSGLDMKLIIIIAAAAVVVVIIILVVVLAGGKKKKAQSAVPQTPYGSRPTPPGPMGNGSAAPYGNGAVPPVNGGPTPPSFTPADAGAGETTVLSAGAGETTVLGGGASRPSAKLIRVKTGESITVNQSEFTIGKEKSRVNYCISGDSSISRSHAKISVSGGEYVVSDLRSTNGTFVNGVKVEPGHPVPLKTGDKLVLSEEEFEFRM